MHRRSRGQFLPKHFPSCVCLPSRQEQQGSKGPTPQGWGRDVCTSLVCWLFWQGSFYCPSTSLGAPQASEFRILTKPDVPISLPVHGALQRRCILAFPKLCTFSRAYTLHSTHYAYKAANRACSSFKMLPRSYVLHKDTENF